MLRGLACIGLLLFWVILGHGKYFAPDGRDVLTNHRQPCQALTQLLAKAQINNKTWEHIIAGTQKKWLRKPHQESWNLSQEVVPENLPYFRAMQMISPIAPTRAYYDYVFFLGGSVPQMKERLEYLIKLKRNGLQFGKLVVLSGQRRLEDNDRIGELPVVTKTEAQAAIALVKQQLNALETSPDDIQVVTAYEKIQNGYPVRPGRADTVLAWREGSPQPGSILAISSQPFVGYQAAVIRTYLPDLFSVETVGEGVDEEKISNAVLLDTLARWIYQQNKFTGLS